MHYDNSFVTVDLETIAANYRAIRKKAGVPVLAVIKADGYGHGAIPVARKLEKECDFFGIATLSEGVQLREAGITTPILVFSPVPAGAFAVAVEMDLRPTIFRYEDALALSEAAQKLGKTARFHFAVDTGMSRIGFQVTEEMPTSAKRFVPCPASLPRVFSAILPRQMLPI